MLKSVAEIEDIMAYVYVVEDDKNIQEIEMFALKNIDYAVEGFECAGDFYKRLYEKLPDLVLLDVMLPDEDGLEILKKMEIFRYEMDTTQNSFFHFFLNAHIVKLLLLYRCFLVLHLVFHHYNAIYNLSFFFQFYFPIIYYSTYFT